MRQELNREQIERSLRAAVDTLTPNVLEHLDIALVDQERNPGAWDGAQLRRMRRRMWTAVLVPAACLCLVVTGGGMFHFHRQNFQVESVIGIDVNPSVELSINRKERVLDVKALNGDAAAVLEEMDLKGVDLNVAVNAVVGSMVTHGYLDEVDNAILVTVTNDSVSKARQLRASVVEDIAATLRENQVAAVVYDQQVIADEEISALAEEYGISYGKAYFLKELIDENQGLSQEDMAELADMTIEEIAGRISQGSLALGELADWAEETFPVTTEAAKPVTTEAPETETSQEETTQVETTPEETTASVTETSAPAPVQPETEQETQEENPVRDDQVEIDFADYEDGMVYVYFVTRVKWKNPTVAVRDTEGNSYAALVDDTSSTECTIDVPGLEPGRAYTFVLGGLIPVETGVATTVRGFFETPAIASALETEDSGEDEEEETDREESTGGEEESREESTSGAEESRDDSQDQTGESLEESEDGTGDTQEETEPEEGREEEGTGTGESR